jgi:hypothetical protein
MLLCTTMAYYGLLWPPLAICGKNQGLLIPSKLQCIYLWCNLSMNLDELSMSFLTQCSGSFKSPGNSDVCVCKRYVKTPLM